jgi:hypothetical protein
MLIRIFSPTECGLIRDADLKKCGLNQMTTVPQPGQHESVNIVPISGWYESTQY